MLYTDYLGIDKELAIVEKSKDDVHAAKEWEKIK